MSSVKRVLNAVSFKKTDYTPVITQVFGYSAVLAGVPVDKYLQDGALLARCQIEAWERFGYDSVFAVMDDYVETEALGSVLEFKKDQYPIVKQYVLSDTSKLKSLIVPNPHEDGRMPELLKAAKILRKEVGDEMLVVGCATGPMTLTTQLLGIETALYLAIDEPEKFSRLLDFSTDVCIKFAIEQVKAGVHIPLIFEPSSSPTVVPPHFFKELISPRLERVFQELKKAGSEANWLHIAGPTIKILPYYAKIGVNIANIDYYVDPIDAKEILTHTCIDGNIKTLSFVTQTPNKIMAESKRLLDIFQDRGGFILSSGCEIPLESKAENIEAMVKSVG